MPTSSRAKAAIPRTTILGFGALLAALLIGFLAAQPPEVLSGDAAADRFSAGRAMADVREIAQAPRPTGSAENARVRSYLAARMRQLGMAVSAQAGPLPSRGAERLAKWGDPGAAGARVVNVVGILPGRDPTKPALLLMAHHDSVWASPGAADDAAGVAAALEILRALKVGGIPERDVVVLLTDAEELGLHGARMFFDRHPLARRTGAVINLEARGGGGRAAMFETGRGNGEWMAVYRHAVARPSANSLAVLIYELMPNSTDFTIPKALGIPGFNFAFIGRSGLYHSPMSTPQALDQGSLQDMGAQGLAVARALASAPALPGRSADAVFGDVLGLFVIAYSPIVGSAILVLAAALFGYAFTLARRRVGLSWRDLAGGAAMAGALLIHTMLLLRIANLISGSGGSTNYYDRLAALPRLELQAFCLCLAALLIACIVARGSRRVLAATPGLVLALLGLLLGGVTLPMIGLGVLGGTLAMGMTAGRSSLWAGWLGLAVPVLLFAFVVQVAAPTAAPVLTWPLLLAVIAAALAAALHPALKRWPALLAILIVAALGGGQLLMLAHFTFLGVGAGMPEVMALYALLIAMLVWPLLRAAASPRLYAALAAMLVLVATGIALSVRLDPIAVTVPPYSERR